MTLAAVTEDEASWATATNMAVTERPGSTPISSASFGLPDWPQAAAPDEARHDLVVRVGGRGPDDDPPRFELLVDGISLGVSTIGDPIGYGEPRSASYRDVAISLHGPRPERITIRFLKDDGWPNRDLYVDRIVLDGETWESEEHGWFTAASPDSARFDGPRDTLYVRGDLDFDLTGAEAHVVTVRAGGRGPSDDPPRFEVFADGVSLGVRTVHDPIASGGSGEAVWRDYAFRVEGARPERVSVRFLNDGGWPNRDLYVDHVRIDDRTLESETDGWFTAAYDGSSRFDGQGEALYVRGDLIFGDVPGDAGTYAGLAPGERIRGEIETAYDEDWYRVVVKAGEIYHFDLIPDDRSGAPLGNPLLRLYDASGDIITEVCEEPGLDGRTRIGFRSDADGEVYVSATVCYTEDVGAYALEARRVSDDIPGDATTSRVLRLGGSGSGGIQWPQDDDWFRVDLAAGISYRFAITPREEAEDALVWARLSLRDEAGAPIEADVVGDRLFYEPDENRRVFLSVAGDGDIGAYRVELTVTIDDDIPGDASTPATMALGSTASGAVERPDDEDWFAVALEPGTQYRFWAWGDEAAGDPLDGARLQLFDGDGKPLTAVDDYRFGRLFFETDATLHAFISVGSEWGDDGRYTVALDAVVDDIPGDATTPATLAVGVVSRAEIDFPDDEDWFRLDPVAGTTYRISAEGDWGSEYPLENWEQRLYDATGAVIPQATWDIYYSATTDASVFVGVFDLNSFTGAYTVSAEILAGEVPGSALSTERIAAGEERRNAVDFDGDRDWFRLTVEAGVTYSAHLLPDEAVDEEPWPLWDPLLRVHDAEGGLIAFDDNDGEGRAARLRFTAAADGQVFVSAGGATYSTGAYRLLAEVAPADIPGDRSTEARLEAGAAAEGEIGTRSDRDWFRFAAVAGEVWRFDVVADEAALDPLREPSIAVYDPSGGPVYEAGGSGPVFLRAGRSGDHFVAISSGWSDLGAYRLTATLVQDDRPGDASATARLGPDEPKAGAVDYTGDEDWFRATLSAGVTYRFDLAPDGSADDPLEYGSVALRDAAGAFIDRRYNSEPLFFTADADREVFVVAGDQGDLGGYRLSMAVVEDDIPGDASTPLTLAEGVAVGGRINWPADADWFGFAPVAGAVYRFDLAPDETTDDPLYGRRVRLLDAAGDVVAEADDGPLYHRVVSGAPLFVAVEGRDGDVGAYGLSVVAIVDDLPDDASTDVALAPGDERAGAVEWPGDEDWFRVPVVAGVVYRFDAQPDGSAEDPLDNRALRLFDAAGPEIATSNGSPIDFRAESDGELLFSVGSSYDDVGVYVASVARIEDPVGEGVGTEAVLGADAAAASALDYQGDEDWFRLDLPAGVHRIDLTPDDSGSDALDYARLRLHDETGAVLSEQYLWDGPIFTDPATSGATFLSVSEIYGHLGGYTLSATPVVDDVAGDASTARSLAVGATADGAIDYTGDADWFRIAVESGAIYRFTVEPDSAADDPIDNPRLALFDADGVMIQERWGDEPLSHRATADGDLFVSVQTAYLDDFGAYRVSAETVVDDTPDDATTTRVLAPGSDVSGVIDFPEDRDWFALAVEAGRTYRVTSASDDATGDPLDGRRLSLHDASGATLAESGWDAALVFTGPADGTVFVAAWSEYDTGAYRLSIDLPDDDLAGDPSTTASLAVGGEARGTVDFEGDSDWFRIDLDPGETYRFEAATAASGRLALHDATGAELSATSLWDGHLVFSAPASGAYFVDVQSDSGGEVYTLRADRLPDDVPGSVATAATLAAGGATGGMIEFDGDEDWFRFAVEAGVIYRFTVAPDGAAADPIDGPTLALFDAEGTMIRERWIGEPLAHRATSEGDLYVSVRSGYDLGAYRLSAETAADDIAGDPSTDRKLTVGEAQAGVVDYAGDADWFRVSLEAGRRYRIDLGADSAAGNPFWGGGTLFDAAGAVLETEQDGIYRPATDETVFVTPAAGSDDDGAYRVSVVLSEDSVGNDPSTTATIAPGETRTGAIDSTPADDAAADEDWYAVMLETGRVYRFDLRTPDWSINGLDYPRLSIHSASGTEIYFEQHLDISDSFFSNQNGLISILLRSGIIIYGVIIGAMRTGALATTNSR